MRKENSSREGDMGSGNGAERAEKLGDFAATIRMIPISLLAMVIGAVCALVALALLRLIGLFTNLFYYGRWSSALISPANNRLGWFAVLVPVGGALIIGVIGAIRVRTNPWAAEYRKQLKRF